MNIKKQTKSLKINPIEMQYKMRNYLLLLHIFIIFLEASTTEFHLYLFRVI